MTKMFMVRDDVLAVGGVVIAQVKNGEFYQGEPLPEVTSAPGFYFMVKGKSGHRLVSSRYAIGRQEKKQGFRGVLSNIRSDRSQANRTMHYNNVVYDVIYVPIEKMKPLTTGYGKGQLALAFTKRHNEAYQNLTEMNRMLSHNFHFILQK